MEKIKTTYNLELERFLSSGFETLHALYRLACIFFEGLWLICKDLFLLMLDQGMVIYRHSPTKFEHINPAEKRISGNFPPRFLT
ncbi:MAG: hypothetical protein HYV97_02210 [Bdellovibrio sp.]|nr:hypothetical protein [Bdellovibrio sp.]